MMQQAMLMNAMSNNPAFVRDNPQLAQQMAMGYGAMTGGPFGPFGMMGAAMSNNGSNAAVTVEERKQGPVKADQQGDNEGSAKEW